ncbi:hypothetical protein TWF481_008294 [Arthrobotrys musiformis]|uniref:Uncharacterized protein n=1 Tax=Arthrobotrys musiformis TaxID=47236 RepID=A0AAV9W6N8_9PEZI
MHCKDKLGSIASLHTDTSKKKTAAQQNVAGWSNTPSPVESRTSLQHVKKPLSSNVRGRVIILTGPATATLDEGRKPALYTLHRGDLMLVIDGLAFLSSLRGRIVSPIVVEGVW